MDGNDKRANTVYTIKRYDTYPNWLMFLRNLECAKIRKEKRDADRTNEVASFCTKGVEQ